MGAQRLEIGIVMLGVASLDRAVAFYRDRLGLGVKFQTPGFAFLEAGTVTLALSEPLGKAAGSMTGATELVFPVANVAESHRMLLDRGVAFTQAPHAVTPTDWAGNFNDPDGHRLSIFGPPGT